nr:hypothetical protein [Streptomyces sp. L-9-10]
MDDFLAEATSEDDFAVLCVVLLFTGQQGPSGAFAVRDDQPGVDVGAVGRHGDALAGRGQAGVTEPDT